MSSPSSPEAKEIGELLAKAQAVRNACDLDLLVFLHRHPRTLLTSEQLATFVGYDIKKIASSLEAFLEAGLLERTQHPMHAARMYLLVLDGPRQKGIRNLLTSASTRVGRQRILQALGHTRSHRGDKSLQGQPSLLKIA